MTYIQGKSSAPRVVSCRLKTDGYMTDMTYIFAPGPGFVCHCVCKYKRVLTNTWALQLQAFAPWARTW